MALKGPPSTRGQMTVELAVMIPVAVAVAVIAVNALLFLGECAAFDREARNAVRIVATSPGYGQTSAQSAAQIEALLQERFVADYLRVSVDSVQKAGGHRAYTACLFFTPTLFGLGVKHEVFGVSLPEIAHESTLVVDTYKTGVII